LKSSEKGFTLLEVIAVVGLLGVLAFLALPYYNRWAEDANFKEAARGVAGALRFARGSAVSTNREHRVEFDVDQNRYRIVRGDRPYNSTAGSWADPANVVRDWTVFSGVAVMRRTLSCDNATDTIIGFNPNGTSGSGYICVMESKSPTTRRYRVGVASTATGRVIVER